MATAAEMAAIEQPHPDPINRENALAFRLATPGIPLAESLPTAPAQNISAASWRGDIPVAHANPPTQAHFKNSAASQGIASATGMFAAPEETKEKGIASGASCRRVRA